MTVSPETEHKRLSRLICILHTPEKKREQKEAESISGQAGAACVSVHCMCVACVRARECVCVCVLPVVWFWQLHHWPPCRGCVMFRGRFKVTVFDRVEAFPH